MRRERKRPTTGLGYHLQYDDQEYEKPFKDLATEHERFIRWLFGDSDSSGFNS